MDNQTISQKLRAYADFLRKTRVPIGEVDVIERLNACANSLDSMAKEIAESESTQE